MNDIELVLKKLGNAARLEAPLQLDVRSQVLHTVVSRRYTNQLDWVPLAAGAVAIATAAMVTFALTPTWNTMLEPWVSYFPK